MGSPDADEVPLPPAGTEESRPSTPESHQSEKEACGDSDKSSKELEIRARALDLAYDVSALLKKFEPWKLIMPTEVRNELEAVSNASATLTELYDRPDMPKL